MTSNLKIVLQRLENDRPARQLWRNGEASLSIVEVRLKNLKQQKQTVKLIELKETNPAELRSKMKQKAD